MSISKKGHLPLHVVICGSMSALPVMEDLAKDFRKEGYRVSTPVSEEGKLDWSTLPLTEAVAIKKGYLNGYFEIIRDADVVLIANVEKHGIAGYVGANTLMEAACGHALRKPIIFLHPVGAQACQLEACAISSGVLHGKGKQLRATLDDVSFFQTSRLQAPQTRASSSKPGSCGCTTQKR